MTVRTAPALVGLLLAAGCAATTAKSERLRPDVSQAVRHEPRASRFDVEHYDLDLRIRPESRAIDGICTVRLFGRRDGLEQVALDLEGLGVRSVIDDSGRTLAFRHEGGQLEIDLAQPLAHDDSVELEISYGGQPAKGLWFAGDRDGVPTQAFTQGECEDARWWFPCWDAPSDRATSELRVTMPATWTSVAAGERVDSVVNEGEGWRRDHWRMTAPHSTYLETLVAGELEVLEGDWGGLPLQFLAPRKWSEYLESSLAATATALDFLSEVTGKRYPFDKYSQACVENFPFGGMENISATTLTVTCLRDELGLRDRTSDGLVVHEAAHQWFGDLLTCRDWSEIWLNEGFATYMTLLYVERTQGLDAFRAGIHDAQERYLNGDVGETRRPIVYSVYRDPMDLFFSGHAYAGGATRLHLLRFVLGDEVFMHGLRLYVGRNAGRGVVTLDLQRAMEEASGEDLTAFFKQWLYTAGFPEFEVRWRWDESRGRVLLTVNQAQVVGDESTSVFETPVLVEIRGAEDARLYRPEITKRRHLFELPFDEEPRWVRFNKYGWIPCRVETQKTTEEWVAIARDDDDVNGRLLAMTKLARIFDAATDAAGRAALATELAGRLDDDPSAAVRAEAAEALGIVGSPESVAALRDAAVTDVDANVRVAALEALRAVGRDAELAAFARETFAERYSWNTMGAAAGLVAAADPDGAFDWISSQLDIDSPHGELQTQLLRHLAGVHDPRTLGLLEGWATMDAAPTMARTEAARQLGSFEREESARATLVGLLQTRLGRLRRAAIEALAELGDAASLAALQRYYATCVFPREKRIIERALGRSGSTTS